MADEQGRRLSDRSRLLGLNDGDPLCDLFAVCVVESSGDSGVILDVNQQLCDLAGYQRHELVGQPLDVLIPEESRGAHRHYRAGYMLRPSVRPMGGPNREVILLHRSGRHIRVLVGLAPIDADCVTAVILPWR